MLEQGRQTIELTNPGLAPGSYTLRLLIDGQAYDRQQVVIDG